MFFYSLGVGRSFQLHLHHSFVSFKLPVRYFVSIYSFLLWFSKVVSSVVSNVVFKTDNSFLIEVQSTSLIHFLELIFPCGLMGLIEA
jgi:hypothetical protein